MSNFEIASVCFAVEFCISTNFEKFSHCVRHTRLTQLSDSELYKRFDITDIDHSCKEENCKEKSKNINEADPRHQKHIAHLHYMTSIKINGESHAKQCKDKNVEVKQEKEKEKKQE